MKNEENSVVYELSEPERYWYEEIPPCEDGFAEERLRLVRAYAKLALIELGLSKD